jgi:hypothetical protein
VSSYRKLQNIYARALPLPAVWEASERVASGGGVSGRTRSTEPLQQLALRFRDKHRASEARELRSNIVTEKCSEVSTFRETHLASEDLNFVNYFSDTEV